MKDHGAYIVFWMLVVFIGLSYLGNAVGPSIVEGMTSSKKKKKKNSDDSDSDDSDSDNSDSGSTKKHHHKRHHKRHRPRRHHHDRHREKNNWHWYDEYESDWDQKKKGADSRAQCNNEISPANSDGYNDGNNGQGMKGGVPAPTQTHHKRHHKHGSGSRGIPSDMIPEGDEDLYILKSEIVPPVCPACPAVTACPDKAECEPCPPCGRCPEAPFECKKVPNYRAANSSYLPMPILNDFSQFGM